MKKMQWSLLKNIPVLFVFLAAFPSLVTAQVYNYRLQTADSLFNAKQFTQSLAHYEEIFKQKQYTPAMFIKMAFVEEGLNRIGESLYYLNLYYLATGDELVLDKMDQLSKKYKLYGYTMDETGQAMLFYQKHHDRISMAVGAVLFFLVSLSVFLRRRNQRPVAVLALALLIAGLFGVHLTAREDDPTVIVAGSNNYLMAGPSGAAPVVEVIDGGHRFEVEKRYDIWVQVRWKGKTAFLRDYQVLPVEL